jgi:hypothetical protein
VKRSGTAVNAAKIDRSEKLRSLDTLGRLARAIELNQDPFADTDKVIAHERKNSFKYGGMTVKGPAEKIFKKPEARQMELFGDTASE